MKKFLVLDYYDDITNELLSPFLKEAQLPEKDKTKFDDSDFALILVYPDHVRRYYPIGTEIDTKLSLDYFTKTASQLPPRARLIAAYHLNKAAEAFGIPVPGYIKTLLDQQNFTIEDNKFIVDYEPPEEEEIDDSTDYLLPDSKMLPIRPDNVEHYLANFDKIAANLDKDLAEEAAFNLLRYIAGQGRKDVKINTSILKYAQAYAQRKVSEIKQKKAQIQAVKLEKMAEQLPVEWDRLNYKQRHAVARLLTKKAEEGGITLPLKTKLLISDYVEPSPQHRVVIQNLARRKELIDENIHKYLGKKDYDEIIQLRNMAFTKLASLLENKKYDEAIKLLETFDEAFELQDYYNREIDDPYVTMSHGINSVFTKAARVIDRNPDPITPDRLQKVAFLVVPPRPAIPERTPINVYSPGVDPFIDVLRGIVQYLEDLF